MDWLHYTSIIICIAQIIYILLYYYPLANEHLTDEDYKGNAFISDFLFNDNIYRSAMTFFVAIQLGVCALYVYRLRESRELSKRVFFLELISFAGAWTGWSILCAQYSNPGGGSRAVHFAGVVVFITCSVIYVSALLHHTYNRECKWTTLARVEFGMTSVFFIISSGLGIDFIIGAVYGHNLAWVTEHISFVFFIASHLMLFIFDSNHQATISGKVATAETVPDTRGIIQEEENRHMPSARFTEQIPSTTSLFEGVKIHNPANQLKPSALAFPLSLQ